MQENKFEKGIQDQMEEFRIRPSAAVWQKVEEELRKKKKRRVVFFIFLLAGLSLLGYSGYFLFNSSKQNLVQQNTSPQQNDNSIKNTELLPGKENSIGKSSPSKKEDQLSLERENSSSDKAINPVRRSDTGLTDKEIAKEENSFLKEEERKTIKKTASKSLPVEKIYKSKNNDDIGVNKNSVQTREKPFRQKEGSDIPAINKEDISQPVVAENNLVEEKQLPVAEENIQTKKDSIVEELVVNNEAIPAATKKKKRPAKINWGIDLSAGISGNRENLFSFSGGQKSFAADYQSAPVNNFNNVSPGIVYSPSAIQSGPAFRAGLVAELKISPKSSISSGLRYSYFSNTIQVGTRNTASALNTTALQRGSISSFYRGFPEKEYTNRYHFIQLPVQYQLQLNKGVKLPVSLNIGASAGYLLATNGLVYDAMAGGVYYRNDDAFNKFQFNLNTGFSFRFGNKGKVQWSLGPELSLGMNKLMKEDYTAKQYLLYGGMTGRIIFAKKK